MAISEDKMRLFTTVKDGKEIGISLEEIYSCLRYYKRDKLGNRNLSLPIQFGNINKWAFHKPVRHATPSPITDEQRASVHCGMRPISVTKLLEQSVSDFAEHQHTKDECLEEVSEWEYLRPSGGETSPFRPRDFDGYNHLAIAPDGEWAQMDISMELLNEMMQVEVNENRSGDYGASYNFKLEPMLNGSLYNRGLYNDFSMRFGVGSGQGIHLKDNMDIPIQYIVSLNGNWRIALAVWLPNYGQYGGWGIFSSRMTIGQFYKESVTSGNFVNLFPDLTTNQLALRVMSEYVASQNGYASFDVVPLLVRNLGNSRTSEGEFYLNPVEGVTTAYCMPSGAQEVQFLCGTPPMPIYFKVSYENVGSMRVAYIENLDTEEHAFTYRYTKAYMGNITSQGERNITLAGGEKLDVESYNNGSGYSLNVKVIAQDGVAVE